MKILHYILMLIITISTTVNAQTVIFNKTFTRNTPVMRNVLITEDGYIVVGGDYNSVWKVEILIVGFDNLGNKLWEKSYGDDLFDYYHGGNNSFIINNDGGYSLSGHRTNTFNEHRACMLTKFDQNFDTLWTKLYFDNPDFTAFYNHIQTADGGYALVGSTDESDPDGDVLLVKTDSNGNMEWYKKYGTSDRDIGLCIIATDDGGYLIGGLTNGIGNGDGYLIKTDSEGNKQWTKHYGNPLYPDGSINTIIRTENNEYVFALSAYVTDPISASFYNRKYGIIKLNSEFEEVWNKLYGIRAEYTSIGTIAVANNGEIFTTVKDDNIVGLFRLSPSGDSISKHYYEPGESIGQRSLFSIKQTPDNGFIMAGVAFDPQVMWLVKTDSCGCVVEDCECGESFVNTVCENSKIDIYPNPASDYTIIPYYLPEDTDGIMEIYDAMGKVIAIYNLYQGDNQLNIDTKNLHPGIYTYTLITKEHGTISKKFIIYK
jgi:hypothetical protein